MTLVFVILGRIIKLKSIFKRLHFISFLPTLDINMPGIDGVEVLRQIKSDPKKRKIPVIMLTTTDDPREVDRCYALGCSSYITKPLDSKAFLKAINRIGLFISIISVPSEEGQK